MSAQPPFNTQDAAPNTNGLNIKKVILMALLVILAGVGAGGAWFFLSGGHANSLAHDDSNSHESKQEANTTEEKAVEESEPPVFVNLETFVVNLQPDGQFLQATFSLELKSEKDAEQFKLYMPQMRSRLLLLLSAKTAAALSDQKGKTDLISEIKELMNQPIKPGVKAIPVADVHVTGFMIQ